MPQPRDGQLVKRQVIFELLTIKSLSKSHVIHPKRVFMNGYLNCIIHTSVFFFCIQDVHGNQGSQPASWWMWGQGRQRRDFFSPSLLWQVSLWDKNKESFLFLQRLSLWHAWPLHLKRVCEALHPAPTCTSVSLFIINTLWVFMIFTLYSWLLSTVKCLMLSFWIKLPLLFSKSVQILTLIFLGILRFFLLLLTVQLQPRLQKKQLQWKTHASSPGSQVSLKIV